MKKDIISEIGEWRLNKFVIIKDVDEGWVLYNTTIGSIVYIHDENDLLASFEMLKQMLFYVPLEFNEMLWVDQLRQNKLSNTIDKGIEGFTILTTTSCNARCYYCYEKGQQKVSMTEKTAMDIADYVKKRALNKFVSLRWFGGEPLVNVKVIDIICKKLIEDGMDFSSSMVSNGLLFTDSIISRAWKVWKVRRVQITIDGTKQVYQNSKLYVNAQGDEFDRVLENISKLAESNIKVSIRLNQNYDNTDNLLELIDFLSERYGDNKLVSAYNSWIYDEKNEFVNGHGMYESFKIVQDKLVKCGLYRNNHLKKKLRVSHCMADNDSSVVISPKGDIGLCEHYPFDHLVGSIYDDSFNCNEIAKWKERYNPSSKCIVCPLYPQCIRIKMCPVAGETCSQIDCENKIELIQNALMNYSSH